jgi:hypothetical protein
MSSKGIMGEPCDRNKVGCMKQAPAKRVGGALSLWGEERLGGKRAALRGEIG